MTPSRPLPRSMLTAMLCAGAVTAQFVSGKATRDALFFASFPLTALPTMLIATSAFSIVAIVLHSRGSRRFPPGVLVPALFAASGALFFIEWALSGRLQSLVAVMAYLHISGVGPILGSGFWLIASERFDPHTAKKRFGQIAGAGTLGGLLSAVLAERVAALVGVEPMLPVLGLLHFYCAWKVRQLALSNEPAGTGVPRRARRTSGPATLPGWQVIRQAPYLQRLAALVLLGTTGAALADYLFKAEAVEMFGRGNGLLRFFAFYYAATSLITFVVQTSTSRFVLGRFGLAFSTSTPSYALVAGGIGGLIAPGFGSMLAARGSETILRSSLFRAGYELFYTPIPNADKRSAKSIIDVGADRLGDAVGGGLVRAVLAVAPGVQYPTILSLAIACSAAAILAASRLNRGYLKTLERSLLDRAIELDLGDVMDGATRTLMLKTLRQQRGTAESHAGDTSRVHGNIGTAMAAAVDPEIQEILWIRSRDRTRVTEVLRNDTGLTPALVPHVIALLAWDPVAEDAVRALRKVAEERVGELIDSLVDPNQDFAVRRRLARVFSACVSQRAVDGLILGLEDGRFEVRYQCGRSLAAILNRNPGVRIDRDQIFAVVSREVAVGRPVWESRRLLGEVDPQEGESFVDEFVRDRAGQSLSHVFTLLALVLPAEPLKIAFRSLHTADQQLQGTALEYLEGVLPPAIRERLWPFLEDRRPSGRAARPRDEIVADLIRSNDSIMLNLEELRRQSAQNFGDGH